ncbi:acyl-CoA carboxylase subunit epsilon [Kineosporia sp. NBRC 101731]|uniref:acyl-CoA carboxylase subunit epsilon n=1 Tax=Kineosporia sp. NBRC 101731 TaxID=3032199 RepID=UPI002557B551|nr:acyl-CoA carboxylase subunit epsilon [Kineosporia sp. NBRC 101731]
MSELRVTAGNPDADELAALVGALLMLAVAPGGDARRASAGWHRPERPARFVAASSWTGRSGRAGRAGRS